jgi:tetratricopeptide (TPR) repeat protein
MVKKVTTMLAALMLSLHAWAQADVAATGEAMAAALNERDVEAVFRMMDVDAVTRLVMKDLGLNASDRESVRKGFPKALRANLDIGVRTIEGTKGTAKFLRSGVRDAKPYALVRYDLGDQGIDYVEYYLAQSRKVEDWYVHSLATLYSSSARLSLATLLKTDSMLFGLFGTRMTTEADLKPFTELRKHLQAQDFASAYRVLESFPEGFRKTRQWALMRVTYGGRIHDATHRAALRELARNFGKEADLQFMLIDHYFFEQQFDRALESLSALERAIGGEDAATANLRGNILIAAKHFDDAAKACRRGMALEDDHTPAYWCLVTVGLATKSGKTAVEGLKAYEKAFAVEFDLDKLGAQDAYKEVARTPEFAAWAKSRRQ